MGQKAMLVINGGSPRLLAAGQSVEGVKVIAVRQDQVVIEVEGRQRALRMGAQTSASPAESGGKVILTADARGHFVTNGTVNGVSLPFLVDTGATLISIGASDARRLGIDTSNGEKVFTQTANGQAPATRVKLNSVRIGDITLQQVDALITQTDMPHALLGMSFLNRMEMLRDGSTMTLKKRF